MNRKDLRATLIKDYLGILPESKDQVTVGREIFQKIIDHLAEPNSVEYIKESEDKAD